MPAVTVQQPLIEQSDFSQGYAPDGEDPQVPDGSLRDCLNLLLDQATGALQTRYGFDLEEDFVGGDVTTDHWVRNIHAFQSPQGAKLVVVLTDGTGGADNVIIILVDIEAATFARIDTAARTWDNPTYPHWGVGVDGVWFGGVVGEPMYSYDDLTNTWNDDAGTNAAWKTWKDDVNDTPNLTTEWPRDYAFKLSDRAIDPDSGNVYAPDRSIRFDDWDSSDETTYVPGDKVSRKQLWDASNIYWKSFKCIKKHDAEADAATTAPGTGTDWRTYWSKVRLPKPADPDSPYETNKSWFLVPTAAETSVAAWYADRLFMRWDDEKDRSRLLFSAPLKPEKDVDIPDVVFDPTDFAPGNDKRGGGGGWIPFNDGTHHGFITALHPFNDRLLVFKRQAVWALVGTDDTTWSTKRIKNGVGCVGPKAVAEMNGLAYFFSDEGLWMTDGQEAREAPGNHRIIDYFRTRMDSSLIDSGAPDHSQEPAMVAFDGFIWISIPDINDGSNPYRTIAYEPGTGSFWPTDLPVLDMARSRDAGITHLYFGSPLSYGDPNLYLYSHDADTDVADGPSPTWFAQTNWWSFGLHRAERRIRRVWSLVKGVATDEVVINAYRNYDSSSSVVTSTRAVADAIPTHYEGAWFADSHAVQFKVSGSLIPAALYGIAVDSEPRRKRYHTG